MRSRPPGRLLKISRTDSKSWVLSPEAAVWMPGRLVKLERAPRSPMFRLEKRFSRLRTEENWVSWPVDRIEDTGATTA